MLEPLYLDTGGCLSTQICQQTLLRLFTLPLKRHPHPHRGVIDERTARDPGGGSSRRQAWRPWPRTPFLICVHQLARVSCFLQHLPMPACSQRPPPGCLHPRPFVQPPPEALQATAHFPPRGSEPSARGSPPPSVPLVCKPDSPGDSSVVSRVVENSRPVICPRLAGAGRRWRGHIAHEHDPLPLAVSWNVGLGGLGFEHPQKVTVKF